MPSWGKELKKLSEQISKQRESRKENVKHLQNSTHDFLKDYQRVNLNGMKQENKQRTQQFIQFKEKVQNLILEFKKEREEGAAAWKDLISRLN